MSSATPAKQPLLLRYMSSTDHKEIGLAYLWFSLFMAVFGGGMAGLIRWQLSEANAGHLTPEFYNQMLSMHATLMIFFVIIPAFTGFGNYFVPILIGARDMAFPKLNAFSLWMLFPAAVLAFGGFFVQGGALAAGWTGYQPLTSKQFSGGPGVDFWILTIHMVGISSILGAINFIVTIFNMRAPGMSMMKMPLFVWSWLVNACMILVATPVLAGVITMALLDRHFGTGFFRASEGGDPLLYQHLFWFYSHPAVYIMILPGFGAVSHVIAAFSRKKVFGYTGMVYAIAGIGIIGFVVWAHHMFTAGMAPWLRMMFSFLTMLIAIPTGVKIFSWIATMWGGALRFTVAMKFAIGMVSLFVIGGISGVILANVPVDVQVHDSYFVVAHLHYVLFGGSMMALMAMAYFWFPKMSGRMLSEKLGNVHFWLFFVGMNWVFLPMHWLGLIGMARRVYTYRPEFEGMNNFISWGYLLLLGGGLLFIYNIIVSLKRGDKVGADPWNVNDIQHTFDWETTSPPLKENFKTIPTVH
jgi:cytochrome c oxidase subunit 1